MRLHRLSYGFVLGYHGCDESVGESLLEGKPFRASENVYDWLGHGIYFWEANPDRGLAFANEASSRKGSKIKAPTVVGAVIDLGFCLDLTTAAGIGFVQRGHQSLKSSLSAAGKALPTNSGDKLRRNLDCAVIGHVHELVAEAGAQPFDTVRGVFTEGKPAYDGAAFDEKTHIQIAVRNPACIKGVFRVPEEHLTI